MWRRPVRPGIFDEEYGSEGAGDEASYENYREETGKKPFENVEGESSPSVGFY